MEEALNPKVPTDMKAPGVSHPTQVGRYYEQKPEARLRKERGQLKFWIFSYTSLNYGLLMTRRSVIAHLFPARSFLYPLSIHSTNSGHPRFTLVSFHIRLPLDFVGRLLTGTLQGELPQYYTTANCAVILVIGTGDSSLQRVAEYGSVIRAQSEYPRLEMWLQPENNSGGHFEG